MVLRTNKDKYRADSVILALGSLSGAKSTMSTGDGYYICKQLGMGFKDTYPALVGFKCEAGDVMPDAGVRAGARISFFLGDSFTSNEDTIVLLKSLFSCDTQSLYDALARLYSTISPPG